MSLLNKGRPHFTGEPVSENHEDKKNCVMNLGRLVCFISFDCRPADSRQE